ncbi:MAG: ammonium transporter [Candidatus Hydrogenedentes bacterium]|nr:ammonium transporter [Candidatus Hydrogenedentota bacterium]
MAVVAGPMIAFAQEAPPAEAAAAEAAPAPTIDSGDTAWLLTSTALVLFMTIPGLSLFYGGLVRTKNVLSVLMQCFAITALVTVLWVIYGYTMAFDTTGMAKGVMNLNSLVGGFSKLFMKGIDASSVTLTIPETVFACFQLTFAIITPALIVGAFAERMKFSAVLVFTTLWFTFVYVPICHMVWAGDGSLIGSHWGVLDFAGGTVVHINAGIAALVSCILIGKRLGYPTTPMAPHNMTMTVTGAGMLWVGWFGFNAGSAVAANGSAGMAMLVTQTATAMAALTWMFIEWFKHGKPSALGTVTGAVAGLVAITPASGTVGPLGALAIGFAVSVICFFAATTMKRALGYDDSLDAFGVHGVGGFVGAVLTGVFASDALGGQVAGLNIGSQVVAQLMGAGLTIVYCGIVSAVILKVVDLIIGLRVDEQEETQGLDLTLHNEAGYNL